MSNGTGVNDNNGMQFAYQVPRYLTFEQFNIICDYRLDWAQLILWLRAYTNSRITNNPDLTAVTNRLYQGVPLSFYNSLQTFYGNVIDQRFSNLLSRFISTSFELTEEMIARNTENVNAITTELYSLSNETASFLASINPYWSKNIWESLLNQTISLLLDGLTNILRGNYELAIQIYDRLLNHAIVMGDYMARGVMADYKIE